jgi:hypothetical protein
VIVHRTCRTGSAASKKLRSNETSIYARDAIHVRWQKYAVPVNRGGFLQGVGCVNVCIINAVSQASGQGDEIVMPTPSSPVIKHPNVWGWPHTGADMVVTQ